MPTLLTGATGYIGSYVAARLLEAGEPLNVLVRARRAQDAAERLWQAWQLHFDFHRFSELARTRVTVYTGDITLPHFGLDDPAYGRLVSTTDSVLHVAASLNRRSEKSCLNVNLRGTLEVIQAARRAAALHGLRRFSHVSTVAVAGCRSHETVAEDQAVDWDRSDYDPYARTKKFCEHMVRELLPDVPRTIFRPSIVLGDSRRPETTQFDMVRAFVFLARLAALPLRPGDRIDIVPVDYVADAVAALHQKAQADHEIYHLSSGDGSETYRQITDALAKAGGGRRPIYLPWLERPFAGAVSLLAGGRGRIGRGATLLQVFFPYLVWDTVFENGRVASELGRRPAPFSGYCEGLLRFSLEHRFRYPYREWPRESGAPTP
ncbi:MAG TPA: SDR family oxidoreductase [Candidatus Acidoferrales bacterium]|nr:SDR family oxidoreductase [Candidatus Acidoferrales bacterium]